MLLVLQTGTFAYPPTDTLSAGKSIIFSPKGESFDKFLYLLSDYAFPVLLDCTFLLTKPVGEWHFYGWPSKCWPIDNGLSMSSQLYELVTIWPGMMISAMHAAFLTELTFRFWPLGFSKSSAMLVVESQFLYRLRDTWMTSTRNDSLPYLCWMEL